MAEQDPRPNILFLHSHNTGRAVQPYGHAVPTPHLQRLASHGAVFRRAFAAAPTCSPSRASFLSGQYPHVAGMLGLAHRGFQMADYDRHLARSLQPYGVHTALSGVEHTAPELAQIGYAEVLSAADTNYPDTAADQDAAAAAAGFLAGNPPEPFFLSVGLNETHRPFAAPDPQAHATEDSRYALPPAPLPDVPELRADTAAFAASARGMDDAYGTVLAALEQAGLAERTLVACFADHGLQFPRNMCTLSDAGLGVYLVLRGPRVTPGVVDQMVSLVDLAPTVYDALGLPPAPWHAGRSLFDALERGAPLHEALYGEVTFHAAYEPARSIRTDRYRYTERFDRRDRPVLPNVDESPGKGYLLSSGWTEQPRPDHMLFDLTFDPHESHNLAEHTKHRTLRERLHAQLHQWMHATGDPLVPDGQVAPPPGTRLDDVDALAPHSPQSPQHSDHR